MSGDGDARLQPLSPSGMHPVPAGYDGRTDPSALSPAPISSASRMDGEASPSTRSGMLVGVGEHIHIMHPPSPLTMLPTPCGDTTVAAELAVTAHTTRRRHHLADRSVGRHPISPGEDRGRTMLGIIASG